MALRIWGGLIAAALGIGWIGLAPADARVRGIILGPPTLPFGTTSFGSVGEYMELDGTVWGTIDPHDPLNRVIQDIELAPRNAEGIAKGTVSYWTDVSILVPVNPNAGNHTMLFDIVNRGTKEAPAEFNVGRTTANPAGDGFLENQGYTLVWAGWQADLLPLPGLVTMTAPIAHQHNGDTITGVVRSEFNLAVAGVGITPPTSTQNIETPFGIPNAAGYATASLDNSNDTMTMRVLQNDPKVPIANSDWAYADCTTVPFPGVPNPQKVCLRNGFDDNHIYELVYTAQDPIVMGLGLAVIRDVASFLRNAAKDDFGNPNPLAGSVKFALLHGESQSGQVLRSYLDLGFNEDETHRQVFDGMQPHIGASRNFLNVRFSQPGRATGLQHVERQYPGAEAPLTYGRTFDPLAGYSHGLLDQCERTSTCPKIVHAMSDIEYWQKAAAAETTDPLGQRDLSIPDNVRIYQFASTQHGGFSPVAALPTKTGPVCEFLQNPNSYTYNLRALLIALQQWVAAGTLPPPSRYSRIDRNSLVPLASFVFPDNPVLAGAQPVFNTRQVFFRGPEYEAEASSGIISVEPPIVLAQYPELVPQVDTDGNDIDGLGTLTLQVPLGTYTGWNIRRAGLGQGDACDIVGGYFPFAVTEAQRVSTGDARPSLQARYGTLANYTAMATTAANTLVAERLMLSSDAAAAIQSATNQAKQAGLQ